MKLGKSLAAQHQSEPETIEPVKRDNGKILSCVKVKFGFTELEPYLVIVISYLIKT